MNAYDVGNLTGLIKRARAEAPTRRVSSLYLVP